MADLNHLPEDDYFILLKNLDSQLKLKLISKLSDSILSDEAEKEKNFYNLCGKLETEETADELIQSINKARYFDSNRDVIL